MQPEARQFLHGYATSATLCLLEVHLKVHSFAFEANPSLEKAMACYGSPLRYATIVSQERATLFVTFKGAAVRQDMS
eukprot:scaffold39296_cov18-Tisochrysis_lutea.AAC.1